MKSGAGQVPLTGHFPQPVHQLQSDMMGLGPITKSMADAELMYAIMSGSHAETIDPSLFRLIMPPISSKYPLSKNTAHVLDIVGQFFRENMHVDKEMPPFLRLRAFVLSTCPNFLLAFWARKRFCLIRSSLPGWPGQPPLSGCVPPFSA